MGYTLSTQVPMEYDDAVAATREALADRGSDPDAMMSLSDESALADGSALAEVAADAKARLVAALAALDARGEA